jgi:hypothetical protein
MASDTTPPERRLRVVAVTVQPLLVWDDGLDLGPGPVVNPISVPLSDLPVTAERILAELPALEEAAKTARITEVE